MKGQFMIISSIVVGIVVISVAATISEVQRNQFTNSRSAYQLEMIETEAEKIPGNHKSRENFRRLVSFIPGSTRTDYWAQNNCFNVTISKTDRRLQLDCIS